MITVVYSLMMISLVAMKFLRKASAKKANTPVVYKNNCDTTNARYAINANGYLEEISGPKVKGQYMD